MAQQSFMRGAMVLSSASVITKILGMVIQVVVARELGAAGFGLFRSVGPIFGMLITIATLALPTALSKVIAENIATKNAAKVQRALQICNGVTLVLSAVVCVLAIIASPIISARWLDPRAFLPFLGALARLPVICLSWVLSSFYMGTQNQTPPAVAWIVETVVRTIITIPLILYMNPFGIAYGALAVMIGAGVGEFAGYLYMLWCYYRRDKAYVFEWLLDVKKGMPLLGDTRGVIRDLVDIALPTTLKNILGIMAYAAEPIIVYMAFAKVGVSKEHATELYGSFGMAIQLLLLPTVLSSSLSSVVIPAVSEAAAMKNARLISRRLSQVIHITLIIGLPSTIYFMLSGHDLATSLYKDGLAGAVLAYIAPVSVFIYVREPLAAMLQGLNKATLSTVISLIGSAIRIYAIYYFVSKPGYGVYGIAAATAITAIFSTAMYLYAVKRYVTLSIDFVNLAKTIIATGIVTVAVHQVHVSMAEQSTVLQVLASVGIGALIYALSLLYMRVIPIATLGRVPWVGPPLAKLFRAMPFLS